MDAEAAEQQEGNPMVPRLDVVGGTQTKNPACQRRQRLDDTKMAPVRRASLQRAFSSAVPLQTAAAKASVDMASASRTVERRFILGFLRPGERIGAPSLPDLCRDAAPMVSPA
jgi:hypothetical protein